MWGVPAKNPSVMPQMLIAEKVNKSTKYSFSMSLSEIKTSHSSIRSTAMKISVALAHTSRFRVRLRVKGESVGLG